LLAPFLLAGLPEIVPAGNSRRAPPDGYLSSPARRLFFFAFAFRQGLFKSCSPPFTIVAKTTGPPAVLGPFFERRRFCYWLNPLLRSFESFLVLALSELASVFSKGPPGPGFPTVSGVFFVISRPPLPPPPFERFSTRKAPLCSDIRLLFLFGSGPGWAVFPRTLGSRYPFTSGACPSFAFVFSFPTMFRLTFLFCTVPSSVAFSFPQRSPVFKWVLSFRRGLNFFSPQSLELYFPTLQGVPCRPGFAVFYHGFICCLLLFALHLLRIL